MSLCTSVVFIIICNVKTANKYCIPFSFSVSSTIPVTDLKSNVNMTLRCSLLTYMGHGTCISGVSLSWGPKTGTNAQVTLDSSCEISLTVTLQKEDNNRKWTCTLTEKGNVKISIDFPSTFSGMCSCYAPRICISSQDL